MRLSLHFVAFGFSLSNRGYPVVFKYNIKIVIKYILPQTQLSHILLIFKLIKYNRVLFDAVYILFHFNVLVSPLRLLF